MRTESLVIVQPGFGANIYNWLRGSLERALGQSGVEATLWTNTFNNVMAVSIRNWWISRARGV